MKAEYDFTEAIQGAIITPPADKVKVCLYLDNASLRCLQEEGDLAEIGYVSLLNRALKESLPRIFPPEDTVQVRDLERLTFRLKNLILKGESHLGYLQEYDIIPSPDKEEEFEGKKRLCFHRAMAWLTTVNNLLDVFFRNQDILYVQKLNEISEKMTVGTSINKMTQILCILEELCFDIDENVFNLDSLNS